MRISACIIVRDEADRIEACLASVAFCDEVLVLDSGSRDGTADLCRRLGARVEETDWPGYAAQRNRAAQRASHNWILSVDADERVDDELRAALVALRETGGPEGPSAALHPVCRKVFALGRWIRHGGWYPEHRPRLYDRRRASWTGMVHEWLEPEGPLGPVLFGHLEHRPFRSLVDHWQRLGRYAELASGEMYAAGRRAGLLTLWLRPWVRFLKMYVLRAGFLDGQAGYLLARLEAAYVFLKYARLRERAQAPRVGPGS